MSGSCYTDYNAMPSQGFQRSQPEAAMRYPVAAGIVAAIALAFPLAALAALLYRFPIPFAGYKSGR